MSVAMDTAIVRNATDADSPGLLRLSCSSNASGGVVWAVDRGPHFFTSFRAEAGGWRVVLAETPSSEVVGCVSVAVRSAYVAGRPMRTCYVSNLLVRPDWRRRGVGDELCRRAAEICRTEAGPDAPVLLAIRQNNPCMRGRIPGPRGLPELRRFGTVGIHATRTQALARAGRPHGVDVSAARPGDIGAMAALSREVFPTRQFAPVFDEDALSRWIEQAPGLKMSDHVLARADGRVVGWLGLWDERVIRSVRVAGYSRRAAMGRMLCDVRARVAGGVRPPRVGDRVGCAVVVHACVPGDRPDVLRALLTRAGEILCGSGCAWLRVAMDPRDGLAPALEGIRTHATWYGTHVTTGASSYQGAPLDDRPTHFDAALA